MEQALATPDAPKIRPGKYLDDETLRRRKENALWHARNQGKFKDQPLTEQETRLLARFPQKDDR